ncbi:MAG: PAS domain S-box protein [Acidimicrobiales bacterium]
MDSDVYADLAENLPDAVVVVDGAGTLRWANRAAERLLGVRAEEFVGTSTLPFVHPEDVGLVAASLQSIQGKDVGTAIEVRVRCPTGWCLVEVKGANLLADPDVAGVVLVLRDITERRRWEVAGNEESRFRALVHNAATIIMLVDAEGRIDSVSAAVTRLLGHDQELVEGRPLVSLVDEPDRARVEEVLRRSADPALRRRLTLEVGLLPEWGGAALPFELHLVNLLDDPTVRGLVVSAHDVTELHRSMAQLAEAQAELLRGERLAAVGRLASMIGHELRNPLTAVTNALYLIRDGLGESIGADTDRRLSMAEREITRALKLAEDLMSYVRPRQASPEPVPLGPMLAELLEALPPPAHIDLEVDVEPATVLADPDQLHEMVGNLLSNAYQSMPDRGAVRVAVHRVPDHAVITVTDQGGGIDPADAERLFEPFFSTKANGTGLGLAIVQQLAEGNGGSVSLRNDDGGVVATVRLPLAPDRRAS